MSDADVDEGIRSWNIDEDLANKDPEKFIEEITSFKRPGQNQKN